MESKNPNIRALRKSDIIEFYDEPFPESVRGLAVELDGVPVGVAGVIHTNPLQAFSTMRDDLRKYPKTIVRTARQIKIILDSYNSPIYAYADEDEKNSVNFLKHVGFDQLDDGVFKWQMS
jgi:hypothetical protein